MGGRREVPQQRRGSRGADPMRPCGFQPNPADGKSRGENIRMIKRYNRQQVILAILQFAVGLALLGVVWLVVMYLAGLIMALIPASWDSSLKTTTVANIIVALFVALAIRRWHRQGEGYRVFKDAAFQAAMI